MTVKTQRDYRPVIILLLVAAVVALSWLYVGERAREFQVGSYVDTGQQQTFTWKLVTSWPKNFPGLGTAPERFAEMVAAMSAGRLTVKVYGGGELVPALAVFDAVSLGSVEMGHSGAYYWKGKTAAAPFFTTVPFGMTAQEMNAWLHYGGGLELWREVYAPFNLMPLAGGNTGVQMGGWFNKEINSVADLKGLKMRIPGIGGEVLNRAGGTAVTLPGGELYTSLQTGVIDATEWVGPFNDVSLGLQQVAKYYYYPGWHEPGSTLEMIVNKDAWESLPPDLQAIVEVAARAANQDMLDLYTARNATTLAELENDHRIELRRFPPDVLAALRVSSEQVLKDVVAGNALAEKVYASYWEFADKVAAYHRISEQAYLESRE